MKTLAEAMDSLEATAMRVKDERDRLRAENVRLVAALRGLVDVYGARYVEAESPHMIAVRALLRDLGEL